MASSAVTWINGEAQLETGFEKECSEATTGGLKVRLDNIDLA
jgi:hypothetical protein